MKKKKMPSARWDAPILIVLFASCVLGVLGIRALLYGEKEDEPPARIVIRVEGVESELASGVQEGERVIDRTNRRLLGTVSEIRRTSTLTEIAPADGTDAIGIARRDLITLDITLIPDHDHTGYFVPPRVWSVGTTITFATPSFSSSGTVIRVER